MFQGELFAVAEDDNVLSGGSAARPIDLRGVTDVWAVLHLEFDEPQKVLLVHTARVVNVGVDFTRVVEVAIAHG